MEGSLADWPPLSKFKIIAVSEEKATVLISPTLWLHNVSRYTPNMYGFMS